MTNTGTERIGLADGCQCGAVRYRLDAAPSRNICHCRMGQKASGGPFMAFGGLPTETFPKPAKFGLVLFRPVDLVAATLKGGSSIRSDAQWERMTK